MAIPERPALNVRTTELIARLAHIDQQLEFVDANENTIERYFKREQLLALRIEIERELHSTSSL
jgi:hypothetical protein